MAALLRSARLLKFSPSGLLQITCTKRNGPPLGRLYSGAFGGRRTEVCSRQISRVCENASSRVWPYAVGCVRSYAVATEEKDEGSIPMRLKQAQQFDWALAKLDSSVRRTGRITKTLLLRIFHDVCRAGYPSSNQSLLLLRSCGSLLPELSLKERTELADYIWVKLQQLGAQYDVSHYNALLKVYLQNEFKFSPTEFLVKMEAANVQPNRVTYQRLIAVYCQKGDIEGASTILGFMKNKDLAITEAVFSSLVTGHARAGDIEGAENILPVMQRAGIEPGPDTYVALLSAYAEKGDPDGMKKTLEAAESADCAVMDRDILQVIFTLAKAGHLQLIPEMIERLRHQRGYIPDAMNLCLSLITEGQEDTAFTILTSFPSLQPDSYSESSSTGNFFLRHCINTDKPLEKIAHYCKELQELNMHSAPFTFTLACALEANKTETSLELMKLLKEQNIPLRTHYFWPIFTWHVKENNTAGMMEVIKCMHELDVVLDVKTLTDFIHPIFPSVQEARQAFKDAAIPLDSENFFLAEIRSVAMRDLAKLYTLLSDPSFPSMDVTLFHNNLIIGFKRSSDVESMVKIIEVVHNDERFSKEDFSSYFLYQLINSMSELQLQEQADKLRRLFSQLAAQNITITANFYRGIRNLLHSVNFLELLKDVIPLVDPEDRLSSDTASADPYVTRLDGDLENKPLGSILRHVIYSGEENLERALELKQHHEGEMTAGCYATLINLCCRRNNVEEALNLKREMSLKEPTVVLDAHKYLILVKTLSRNDRLEEALDILKEMKEKGVVLSDAHISVLFHTLNAVVAYNGIPAVQQMQDTIFTLGLAKPTANLCSPVITAYLESKDFAGALEAAQECQKRYKQLPRIHDIIVALVEKGDTDLLQKAMDIVSQERGEMTMLYDLLFAFLWTGRYREARKIIETPGLRAKPGRLQWFSEKCIIAKQMEPLEQMVDITAQLFECDRDEMYSYILRFCKETNNWQKAEAVWMKMQEENVIPRERTLRLLAEILKSNGQEVPFEVPEAWYEQTATTEEVKKTETTPTTAEGANEYQRHMLMLCKKGQANEAYKLLKEAGENGVELSPITYNHVIRALLAKGDIDNAMVVKDIAQSRMPDFKLTAEASNLLIVSYSKKGRVKDALEKLKSMLESDQLPSHFSITRLVQAQGNCGDLAGIQEVESLIKSLGTAPNLSSMAFINNTALAHIKNGNVESAVELLEEVYTSQDSTKLSMAFVFKKLLEADNDKALDKLSAMAERLANHFACYRPASDLFTQLLDADKVEEAKFMLARCSALAEQKEVLKSFLTQKAQSPGQLGKIKNLLSLIPDFTEKEILYPYLMKCHSKDKDLPSAKALHEQMQKEGIAVDELSLKRLAELYREAGEEVPFVEPPKTHRFYANLLKERSAKAQETAEE